jgi:hypothetical protein
MNEHDADEYLLRTVRHLRTIALALLGGPIILGIVMTALHFTLFKEKPLAPDIPRIGGISVLTFVASFVAVSSVVVSFIVNQSHRTQTAVRVARQSPTASPADGTALLVGWQVSTLIRLALIEGAAVLAIIMFLLSADFAALAIAAILIAILLVGIPNEMTARSWLQIADDELQRLRRDST